MKTIFFMRHAKSDWSNYEQSDFERTLNKRGKRDAPAMGKFLSKQNLSSLGDGVHPQRIFSSPAKRAKKTAILLANELESDLSIEYVQEFYEAASAKQLLHPIMELPKKINSAMIVSHNMTLESTVNHFIRHQHNYIEMKTAMIAIVSFDTDDWEQIDKMQGTLVDVFSPREI